MNSIKSLIVGIDKKEIAPVPAYAQLDFQGLRGLIEETGKDRARIKALLAECIDNIFLFKSDMREQIKSLYASSLTGNFLLENEKSILAEMYAMDPKTTQDYCMQQGIATQWLKGVGSKSDNEHENDDKEEEPKIFTVENFHEIVTLLKNETESAVKLLSGDAYK